MSYKTHPSPINSSLGIHLLRQLSIVSERLLKRYGKRPGKDCLGSTLPSAAPFVFFSVPRLRKCPVLMAFKPLLRPRLESILISRKIVARLCPEPQCSGHSEFLAVVLSPQSGCGRTYQNTTLWLAFPFPAKAHELCSAQ